MRKVLIIIAIFFLIIILLLSYKYFKSPNYITEAKAKEIAIQNINKDNNYTFDKVELQISNNEFVYLLNFQDQEYYYEYTINAKTKKIETSKKTAKLNGLIDNESIINIVLNHLNITKKDATIISNDVLIEDTIPFYKTVIKYKNTIYEYKVNGMIGQIASIVQYQEEK